LCLVDWFIGCFEDGNNGISGWGISWEAGEGCCCDVLHLW
jgi:hypothetical protein